MSKLQLESNINTKTKVSYKPDLRLELLSKYKHSESSPTVIREPSIPHFVENCWFPVNLIKICKNVIKSPPKKMPPSAFNFEPSSLEAAKNWRVLETFELDFSKVLKAEKDSQLVYSSKCKDITLLELIFKNHPPWSKMKSHLSRGSSYPLTLISKEEERRYLEEAFNFGNHNGVSKNQKLFESIIDK